MGDEMHRRDPSCAGLLKDFHTAWALSVICRIASFLVAIGLGADIGLHRR
jgi:hypothetical protein